MTTYQFNMKLTPAEAHDLVHAVQRMIEHCETQLSSGAGAPYWAHAHSCRAILSELNSVPANAERALTFGDGTFIALSAALRAYCPYLYEKLSSAMPKMASTNNLHLFRD